MEPNLFRYIWRHSRREQLILFAMVIAALPFYFLSLNLPKLIVNGIEAVLKGQGVPGPFLRIAVPGTEPGSEWILFGGLDLDATSYHFGLCAIFLLLVFVNGGFKFFVNTRKGQMGERMLRRLRYELVDRVLRFPTAYFRRLKPSEVATMVKDEVEPLGGFIGSAFVQPLYQGGLALTATVFILVQNIWLGMVAVVVVLIQAFIIPRLRVPILALGKKRQLAARELAGRVGELVEGVAEVHTHDTSNFERADISSRLGRIYHIRYEIYQRKFFVKGLNNFLAQIPMFLFLALGGYLVLTGKLDIGQLVAVIAAYKDLPPPIRELINWDQQRMDVQIKYDQVVEQFNPEGILPAELQKAEPGPVPPLPKPITARNVTVMDDSGARLLDSVSFSLDPGERVAVIGPPGGGKEYLGPLLVRLIQPTSGRVQIGSDDLLSLPESLIGRRIAYLSQESYIFPGSVRGNLLYSLKHAPLTSHEDGQRAMEIEESLAAGNSPFHPSDGWIDYQAAGASGPEDLEARIADVLRVVDLEEDLYRLGLLGRLDADQHADVSARILMARARMHDRLNGDGDSHLVEPFDAAAYNKNATVAENILFGTSREPGVTIADIIGTRDLIELLRRAGLYEQLVSMGAEIARIMVDIFSGLPAGHPFFEQFSFIAADDLPYYQGLTTRAARDGLAVLSTAERRSLLVLTYDYVEARHRLGLVNEEMESRIVDARRRIMTELPEDIRSRIEFIDAGRYDFSFSVQDNILFGRIAYGQAGSEERIAELIGEVLAEMDLRPLVLRLGLEFDVGTGGKRLTAAQRQKIALARALLKRPDLLIVNSALAVLEAASQVTVLGNVLDDHPNMGVIWALGRPEYAGRFDRVWTMERGRVVRETKPDRTSDGGRWRESADAAGPAQ